MRCISKPRFSIREVGFFILESGMVISINKKMGFVLRYH